MQRATKAVVISGIALIAAGCGSSGHKTTTSAAGTPASSSASGGSSSSGGSNSSGGSGGAYGPYGSTDSSSTSGSSAGSSATAVKLTTKREGKLGTILAAGPKQLTVYMFEGDTTGISNCNGACASVWPPVTTSAAPTIGGSAVQADLTTIMRSDGTKQLAYKGHPLYYFVRDKDSGDAYGEGVHGFGHDWYALAPNGSKVDNS